jgi:hypothetical protein
MPYNQNAHDQLKALVDLWNKTHPPEHKVNLLPKGDLPLYEISFDNDPRKAVDVPEPPGDLRLSDGEELRIQYDLQNML